MADSRSQVVAIIGLGTMGRRIALLCLVNGHRVMATSRTPESTARSLGALNKELARRVAKGKMTKEQMDLLSSRISRLEDFSDLSGAHVVIEAAPENLGLKREIYRAIEPHLEEGAILATNTSSLPIGELADGLRHPARFLGIHFFNPPEVMKLVELRKSNKTSSESVDAAREFVGGLGRTSMEVPDVPGYYVNRILFPMLVESIRILDRNDGANAKDIDDSMKLGANHPMGPLELCDFIGNDVVLSICEVLWQHTREPQYEPPELLRKMVAEKKLGKKTGQGFHSYQ